MITLKPIIQNRFLLLQKVRLRDLPPYTYKTSIQTFIFKYHISLFILSYDLQGKYLNIIDIFENLMFENATKKNLAICTDSKC